MPFKLYQLSGLLYEPADAQFSKLLLGICVNADKVANVTATIIKIEFVIV